ncbi:MAG: hypothetical protein AAF349_17460 [Cyanobacteria bacterium P01_A01_bin.68]
MMLLLLIPYFGFCTASLLISRRMETILSIFLDENTEISNETVLNKYKSTVRQCMHLTLAQIGIIIAGLCICIVFIWNKGLIASFSISIFIYIIKGFGQETVKLEKKARALDCANSDLEEQYQRISHTWVKKALPDF